MARAYIVSLCFFALVGVVLAWEQYAGGASHSFQSSATGPTPLGYYASRTTSDSTFAYDPVPSEYASQIVVYQGNQIKWQTNFPTGGITPEQNQIRLGAWGRPAVMMSLPNNTQWEYAQTGVVVTSRNICGKPATYYGCAEPNQQLMALSLQTGEVIWQRTFSTNTYGVLSSPTISSDGWIYVIDLGKHFRYDAFLRKVNIVTGSSIWSTSISQVTCQYDSFSTGYACLKMQPSLVESQNLVIVGVQGMARAYDMKNGELKWVYSYSDSAFQSGSPIAASAEVSVVAAQGNIYMLNTTTGELIHDSYFPGISDGNDAREAFVAIDAGARRAYVAGGTSLAAYSFIGTRIFIQESQDYKYVASGVVDGNGQLYLACYQTTSTSKLIELPPTGIPLSQVSLPLPITDIILPGDGNIVAISPNELTLVSKSPITNPFYLTPGTPTSSNIAPSNTAPSLYYSPTGSDTAPTSSSIGLPVGAIVGIVVGSVVFVIVLVVAIICCVRRASTRYVLHPLNLNSNPHYSMTIDSTYVPPYVPGADYDPNAPSAPPIDENGDPVIHIELDADGVYTSGYSGSTFSMPKPPTIPPHDPHAAIRRQNEEMHRQRQQIENQRRHTESMNRISQQQIHESNRRTQQIIQTNNQNFVMRQQQQQQWQTNFNNNVARIQAQNNAYRPPPMNHQRPGGGF